MKKRYQTWGKLFSTGEFSLEPAYTSEVNLCGEKKCVFGNGRSYGDQATFEKGSQLFTRSSIDSFRLMKQKAS